jgi:hypothetical protein
MNIKSISNKPKKQVKDSFEDKKAKLLEKYDGIVVDEGKVYYPDRDLTPAEADEIINYLDEAGVQAFYDNTLGIVTVDEPLQHQLFDNWDFPEEGHSTDVVISPETGLDGVATITNVKGEMLTIVKNGDKKAEGVWNPETDGYFHDWVLDLAFKVQDCDLTQFPDYNTAAPDQPGMSCVHEGLNYNISADDAKGEASFEMSVSPSGGIITTESYGNVPAVFGTELPVQGSIITAEELRDILTKVLVQLGVPTQVSDSLINDRTKHSYNKCKDSISKMERWMAARSLVYVNDSRSILTKISDNIKAKATSLGLQAVEVKGKLEITA